MAAAAPGKLLLLLLPAFSLAQDSCRQKVLLLREQMVEVKKVAMESKLYKMAASIEKLESEAAQANVKSAEMLKQKRQKEQQPNWSGARPWHMQR